MAVLATLLTACGQPESALPGVAPGLDRKQCAAEAERLVEDIEVATAGLLRTLPAGHFIYRCGRSAGGYTVMFAEADEAVDCQSRQTGRACSMGIAASEPKAIQFD